MNRKELISAMAEKSNLPKMALDTALDVFEESVAEALVKGDSVQLVGFGTFKTAERKARTGINPQTKKEIKIEAKTVAQFKVGKALAEAVNCKKQ